MTQDELYKNRSYGGCIKAGYKTVADNFKEIFRRTWVIALILALTGGAMLTARLCYIKQPLYSVLALPLVLAAALVWYGRTYQMLNGKSLAWNTLRVLKARLVVALFVLIGALVMAAIYTAILYAIGTDKMIRRDTAYILVGAYVLLSMLIVAVFTLPLACGAIKYQFEASCPLFKTIVGGYGRTARYLGLLVVVFIIVSIISAVIQTILFSPCDIIIMASTLSNAGMAAGDPSGLPASFPLLVFAGGVVTTFCMAYVVMWAEYTLYYTYGTIETRENERLKAKNLIYRP